MLLERNVDAIRHFKNEEFKHSYPAFCCDKKQLSERDVHCNLADVHGLRNSKCSAVKKASPKRERDGLELDLLKDEVTQPES